MDALELLTKRNTEDIDSNVDFLISGGAADYAEYKHICGVIRGLNLANAQIRDLAERLSKQDDDDGT